MENVALDGTATTTSFDVKWDAVQGAKQYFIAWGTDLDGDPREVASVLIDGSLTTQTIDEALNTSLSHDDLNPMAGKTIIVEVMALAGKRYTTADEVQASAEYKSATWSDRLSVAVPATAPAPEPEP